MGRRLEGSDGTSSMTVTASHTAQKLTDLVGELATRSDAFAARWAKKPASTT
jgi:hypothetical protein